MGWRVQYFQTQQVRHTGGWGMSFWNSVGDKAAVIAEARRLRDDFSGLHGRSVRFPRFRVSDPTDSRAAEVVEIPSTTNNSVGTNDHADYPTNAVNIVLRAGEFYRASCWIRGVIDGNVALGGFFVGGGVFDTFFARFRARLLTASNNWSLYPLDRLQERKPIKSITIAGVVSVPGHGYPDNAIVRIGRVVSPAVANDEWRITFIDADTFSLVGWVPTAVAPVVKKSSYVKRQVHTFVPINEVKTPFATKKNVGRPFGLLSGRQKSRAS